MKEISIHFPIDTYRRNNGLDKFGEIHLKVGDLAFPNEVWTDFGLYLAAWWTQEYIKLQKGEAEVVPFRFMDGSYRVNVQRLSNKACRLTGVTERRDEDKLEELGEVDFRELGEQLSEMLQKIIDERKGNEEQVSWKELQTDLINSLG